MTLVREITDPGATLYLGQLASRAHEATANLANSLVTLRNALDRGHPGEIFAALTAFESAAGKARTAADEVLGEAIDRHGYF